MTRTSRALIWRFMRVFLSMVRSGSLRRAAGAAVVHDWPSELQAPAGLARDDVGRHLGDRHRAAILARAQAQGDGARLLLARADDPHVGGLRQLGLADLVAQLVGPRVELDPHAGGGQLGADPLAVLG